MPDPIDSYTGRSTTAIVSASGGSKAVLGVLGLGSTQGEGKRTALSSPAVQPRISATAVNATGGTMTQLIESLIEACRTGTMDVRERAAAALHSLAGQAKENAETIGGKGLEQLITLLDVGSPDAQAHAAAALGAVTRFSKEHQVRTHARMRLSSYECFYYFLTHTHSLSLSPLASLPCAALGRQARRCRLPHLPTEGRGRGSGAVRRSDCSDLNT